MEQVTVMAEPVATAAGRSILLACDRQAHVLRNPLDDLIACSVGFDDPAVATDREREGEVQRGDLRVLPHLVVRPDGVQPDQVGDVLLDVTKRGPRNKTGVTVTDFLFERRGHALTSLGDGPGAALLIHQDRQGDGDLSTIPTRSTEES
jgi:hypothetical protein